jgi:feruloyl-CoA synthase
MNAIERDPLRLFAPAAVQMERRHDGSLLLRSPQPLAISARCVGDWLVEWAQRTPNQLFVAERNAQGEWQGLTYQQALARVRRIAAWLLRQQLSVKRSVAILSDNSVEHALLSLAAMHIGVPVVSISPAYSYVSKDFAKLKTIFSAARPGVVYAADGARSAKALAAVRDLYEGVVVVSEGQQALVGAISFDELLTTTLNAASEAEVDQAFAAVGPDTIAKLLFTSGSTGSPKGVINTQRMMCVNQTQIAQLWPFLRATPPVLVDWLPWSHTFGGNHNFNMVLSNGGTLYIDNGRPVPGQFQHSAANLREIAPTVFLNVPRGYDMLVTELRADEQLRRNFFSRLQVIFYAAAALPQHLWRALESLSLETTGQRVVLVSSWGSTETAPLVTLGHFRAERAGMIGLPAPGCELKLLAAGPKLEIRVRGPQITTGYWDLPELTAKAFDAEGFYITGDAVRLVDEQHPEFGLYFDGRVSEDFKLTTGTWVNVGGLRVKALESLAGIAQDLVVAGHDRDDIGFLIFPNLQACRKLCGDLPADTPVNAVIEHPALHAALRTALQALRAAGGGSSTYAARALLLADPPSIDAGEITDKGYINQGAVLAKRTALVERLYDVAPHPHVVAC